jgi:hypothetical protein
MLPSTLGFRRSTVSERFGRSAIVAVLLLIVQMSLSGVPPSEAVEQFHILSRWPGSTPEHYYWDGSQWRGWNVIGGKQITSPPGVTSSQGQLQLFAVGTDSHVYQARWDGTSWNGWFDLNCCFANVAATDYSGYLIVVAQGTDNHLYLSYFDPRVNQWFGWYDLASNVFGRPAVTSYNGQLHIFVIAGDNNYYQYFYDGQRFNGFFKVGGPFAAGPAAAVYHGQLYVFGPGNDGNLYHEFFDGQQWNGFFNDNAPAGTTIEGSVGAATYGSDLLLAVVRGQNGSLYVRVFGGNFGTVFYGPLGQALSGPGATNHQGAGNPGGPNHPPTLSSVQASRLVHSFGRDDSFRSEGLTGRPGVNALQALLAPATGVTLTNTALVTAASALADCCTLLVAEGAADPDGNPVVFHWQAVTGTFYSTGSANSGGFPFGAKITDILVYNRNSVFWEAPSIGFPVLFWNLMGGLTNVGVKVTDVPTTGQPLSSDTKFVALEWDRTIHLDGVTVTTSRRLPSNDPHHPGGIELQFLPVIKGNSANPGGLPVTLRIECNNRVSDVVDGVAGAPAICQYDADQENQQVTITAIATVGGNFIFPPTGSALDLHRSRGCTYGTTTPITIKLSTNACNDTVVAGGDTPETHIVEMGQSHGTFQFDWETYTIADRIVVTYQGNTLFDTGCVGANGIEHLTYSGSSTSVTVQVFPNCNGGTTGTQWTFTVHCPTP